jgi:hypothetical protein
MRLISSPRATFYYQKVSPVLLLLIASGLGIWSLAEWVFKDSPEFHRTFFSVVFVISLAFLGRKFRSDLADEVWLDGETLIVKCKGEKARIEGEMLRWVDAPDSFTVSIVFKSATPLGMKIVFVPKMEGFGDHKRESSKNSRKCNDAIVEAKTSLLRF